MVPSTAILTGDVMMVISYDYISKIGSPHIRRILHLYNQTASHVCEGQQLDMDFEQRSEVGMDEYLNMIGLKTSVLLAASLQIGAILGGAGLGNQDKIYQFGKDLGLAFQIQDDYLDCYGDAAKFGKKPGGDILAGKKTFLLVKTLEAASAAQRRRMVELGKAPDDEKIAGMLEIYHSCGADTWVRELKEQFRQAAHQSLEDIAVLSRRKEPLQQLTDFLLQREF